MPIGNKKKVKKSKKKKLSKVFLPPIYKIPVYEDPFIISPKTNLIISLLEPINPLTDILIETPLITPIVNFENLIRKKYHYSLKELVFFNENKEILKNKNITLEEIGYKENKNHRLYYDYNALHSPVL